GHCAGLGGQQAEEGFEQGGLARAVGTKEADDLAWANGDICVAADGMARIAEPQSPCLESHDQTLPPRARSHRNTGAPTTAVRMPSGTSTADMVRASVSTRSMYPAPAAIDAGSRLPKLGPTSIR